MNRAIIIMTKIPRAGNVKTRLQPYLSPEQSAEIAAAFLQDAVEKAKKICSETIIAFAPPEEKDFLFNFVSPQNIFVAQSGANLGERMYNAFQFAFESGADSVIMIGTDSPSLPSEFIERAFSFLNNNDAVLGESEDGGYYLIGLNTVKTEIFEDVEWSSPNAFRQTVRNIKNCNLKLEFVPIWHDVDFPEDLKRLKTELEKNPVGAPKTARWIREN